VLAVVICAIALSLAYPVREYIAQRRQIDQLQAERQMLNGQLASLQHQQQRLGDPAYVEQLARNKLHMCLRGETCYIVIGGQTAGRVAAASLTPWYERLWQSVQEANRGSPR
jgi:cell division protein FtsL